MYKVSGCTSFSEISSNEEVLCLIPSYLYWQLSDAIQVKAASLLINQSTVQTHAFALSVIQCIPT